MENQMICDFCNYAGEPTEFVDVFGLVACADFGGCLNRQAEERPSDYELAVMAIDRAAYEKRKEAQESNE